MFKTFIISNYIILNQMGGAKLKWKTLQHNGVLFPPEYVKHNTPVIYHDMRIILDAASEELATLYAKYIETDYVKNRIFRKNFWNDWQQALGANHEIKSLDDVDFSLIYEYILTQKAESKSNSAHTKSLREEIEMPYKTAIVDGVAEPVANFRVEPPGIFLGRGCNPKLGHVKRRIYPEDIVLNIGKDAVIPSTIPNHKWGSIIHDRTVEWLASWHDDITGKTKYVWLGASSNIRGKGDMVKFDLARKLKRNIKKIHADNEIAMRDPNSTTRQIATAVYFIDDFALRIGNEKGSDETDTVGVVSLRVEHLKLMPNNRIKLDFLGKDSVRYNRELVVNPVVYRNLIDFTVDKLPQNQLFDLINPIDVNNYLHNFMPKLTAKVFRTYNASNLFQKELQRISKKYDKYELNDKINVLLDEFNKANAKVAALCNHQKNITKNTNAQISKLDEMIKNSAAKLKKARASKTSADKITKMSQVLKKLRAKRELKLELKNISLGTSKINYIDPRITVAFIHYHNIPIDKIFSKTLQEKFKWAMKTQPDFKF